LVVPDVGAAATPAALEPQCSSMISLGLMRLGRLAFGLSSWLSSFGN
jgi:hypothetical protein